MKKILILLGLLVAISVSIVATAYFLPSISKSRNLMTDHENFEVHDILLTDYDINDLGTVDSNGDGILDLYTTNHSAIQNLLIGDGIGSFTDIFLSSGLEQALGYPSVGDTDLKPNTSTLGFYIFRHKRILHLENRRSKQTEPATGSLSVGWPLIIKSCKKCTYKLNESTNSNGLVESILEFEIKPGGKLLLNGKRNIVELPHAISLTPSTPPEEIFIGLNRISPPSPNFELQWRDRHGMAWTDINQDGLLDVYISRGGVKGQAAMLSHKIQDELFLQTAVGKFTNSPTVFKTLEHECPGRKVNWVDIDSNSSLDIYIVCGRDKTEPHPNRVLLAQKSPQEFSQFALDNQLNFQFLAQYIWIDTDFDSDLDLFTVEGANAVLYQNNSGNYSAIPLQSNPIEQVVKLAYADFDNDADTDVFVVSTARNTLFRNDKGTFVEIDPSTIGLPVRSNTANWVDVNNDGLTDMHSLPDGLVMQNKDGTFSPTSGLAHIKPGKLNKAICSWFDANNDGTRDVACSTEQYPYRLESGVRRHVFKDPAYTYWKTYYYLNNSTSGDYLEIRLVGPSNNSAGLGSTIEVTTDSGVRIAQIGESEGSHFSQGHYRTYFGLGRQDTPVKVKVHWFDGTEQTLESVESNQIIDISYP